MRVFFVRHGESEANTQRIFSNTGWKHPLTQRGREQTQALAERLVERRITEIFTSPIMRASESAEIVGAHLNIPVKTASALAEWDVGIYEDRPHDEGNAAYSEVEKQWLAGNLDARLPKGESCADIHARFTPFIAQLIEKYGASDEAALVLMGHGGTYRNALPKVLSNISTDFAMAHGLDNTSFVEAELRNGALHCVKWAGETVE
jgi:broad specificity phosphatase PhoE